jgi:hypothetical protein
MARSVRITLLFSAAFCSPLIAEQPILQPQRFVYRFEGPALGLECVGTLKREPEKFSTAFRAKSADARRTCVAQLLQSLTPEPDFTADDFQKAFRGDSYGILIPLSPGLTLRMSNRLGVNLAVSKAIASLAGGHLIDDPSVIHPLIQCLNHPLLEVSEACNHALVSLTRHGYGEKFYYDHPRGVPATVEGRQRFIADWTEWEGQIKNGQPIFDAWLESECVTALRGIGTRLASVLKGTASSGYLDHDLVKSPSVYFSSNSTLPERVFEFDDSLASNRLPGEKVDRVFIVMFRPGISHPRSESPDEIAGLSLPMFGKRLIDGDFRERFPALDLEFRVEIASDDAVLRRECFLEVKAALNGLRDADRIAASRQ